MLCSFSLVQEESAEFILLDASECIVHHRQHQVHQKVQVDGQIGDEKGRGPATVVIGFHHDIRITEIGFCLHLSRKLKMKFFS